MRIVIAAPSNGTELGNALKTRLQIGPRASRLTDLSTPDGAYPQPSSAAAQEVAAERAGRAILICDMGIGTVITVNKVYDIRTTVAHDLVTVRDSVENYGAQVLCIGQNIVAAPAVQALVDI